MRLWPFQRRETRADSSYTDALVAAITANASGQTTAFPTATAALEACAGLIGRAFASASIQGAPDHVTEAVTPALLNLAGRSLIRRGEILFAIDVSDGGLYLRPVSSHDIHGDYSRWDYRLNLAGPSEQITRDRVPAEGVCHVMYSADPETPWRGVGPLGVAQLAGRLSAETTAALADEASGPRGSFLPLPRTDGADDTITALNPDFSPKNSVESDYLLQTNSYRNFREATKIQGVFPFRAVFRPAAGGFARFRRAIARRPVSPSSFPCFATHR